MSESDKGDADADADADAAADAEADADAAADADPDASTGKTWALAGIVTLASAGAVGKAFSEETAGTPWMLGTLALVYGALAALTVFRLRERGELGEQLRPRGGDLSIGFFVAAVLYGVAMAVHMLVTTPPSPRSLWIMRIYATLGDPSSESRHLVGGVVFGVAALEELVWRGLAMRVLCERYGWLRGWIVQAALFGLAHVPTMFLLGDARVGPNPLLVAAGVAYSLVWGRMAMRFDRLPPAIFAHALFTWAVFEFPIWRP